MLPSYFIHMCLRRVRSKGHVVNLVHDRLPPASMRSSLALVMFINYRVFHTTGAFRTAGVCKAPGT
jgi:hypothetical protein